VATIQLGNRLLLWGGVHRVTYTLARTKSFTSLKELTKCTVGTFAALFPQEHVPFYREEFHTAFATPG
jgi:hypothetical protein